MTEPAKTTNPAVADKQWALKKESLTRRHLKISGGAVKPFTPKAPPERIVVVATEQEKAAEEALKNPEPGQEIPGQGVFLGKYQPKDRNGKSLGKTFNVFAAPQDLEVSGQRASLTYVDTVKCVAALKSWKGFDGTNYANDEELYKALKDGSYKGGWIIPPIELLSGTDVDEARTQADSLYDSLDKGAFRGTFTTTAPGAVAPVFPAWYWSCTEKRNDDTKVRTYLISRGTPLREEKNQYRQSCRLVRLVAVR